ncbi:MAG: D-alanyl-D-alanine carboxypeptidase [Tissierellia bacterium]|nr:D-alanyl-D-alanine carboxypeptidase [Tissierellia bacterium]
MRNKFFKVFILSLAFIFIFNNISFATIGIEEEVSAYLIGDYETGEILEEYNIYKPVEIASITKLMSYLIVMEAIEKGSISLEDKVYIDEDIIKVKGSSLKLKKGEVFTVEELLKASMVVSANDATYALGKFVAGSEDAFVARMNEKAKELDLSSAIFFNSTGLPEKDLQNIMSPLDIFYLSRYIIENYPDILSITTIPSIEISSREYIKENTNPLLGKINGVDGLKTGYTDKAGYCLVSTAKKNKTTPNEKDFRLISIIMGTESEEKRGEIGEKLLQYALDNYSKKLLLDTNRPVDIIYLPKSKEKEIEVYPMESFSAIIKNNDNIDIKVLIDEGLKLPLKSGEKVGNAMVIKNREILEEIDLIVMDDVKKENIFIYIIRIIKEFFNGK